MSPLANLASALVQAQGSFPTITRDKKVTVKTKTGGTYEFAYAPLDSILNAVRKPLSDNGLAIVQLLDHEALVTILLHSSGESLEGRTALPEASDIQGFGSAITYLRRYAIQALLGIAAEEDDDGNRAIGNQAKARASGERTPPTPILSAADVHPDADGLVTLDGTVAGGKSAPVDLLLRQSSEGPMLGFVLVSERTGRTQVVAVGQLADDLWDAIEHDGSHIQGKPATVTGRLERVAWTKDGKDMPPYKRLTLERITALGWTLPDAPVEADSLPLFEEPVP